MHRIAGLLAANKEWAERLRADDREVFDRLAEGQRPQYLWIGCSDSRISPLTSLGLAEGEMFIHRNVANLVVHSDLNCLSALQFAVDVLKVEHVIVCGHFGCGGVTAAFEDARFGLVDNWLRHIQDTMHKHAAELSAIEDPAARVDKLCELNVIEQVINVGETTIVQDAWDRGQLLYVHGWIYRIREGVFRDLGVTVDALEKLDAMRDATYQNRQKTTIA